MTSDPLGLAEETRKVVAKVGDWVEPFLKFAAAVSAVLSLILVWAAKDDLHLLAWIEEDVTVYPAEATGDLSLPLEFDGQAARSVRMIKTKVVNYGKQTIGTPEALWELHLEAPPGSTLVSLKAPIVTPPTVVVADPTRGANPNVLALQLGAFPAGSTIDLQLLLVNASAGPALRVNSSLPGLPHETSTEKPVERLAKRVFGWTFLFVLLLLSVEAVPLAIAESRKRPSAWGKMGVWLGRGMGGVLLAALGGYMLAYGLAYVVSWFL